MVQLFQKVYFYLKQALKITSHQKTYINEIFSWNETPYDLLSIAYLDSDKLCNTLDVLKAGILIAFPEIQDCLTDEWSTAYNLIQVHNIHQ